MQSLTSPKGAQTLGAVIDDSVLQNIYAPTQRISQNQNKIYESYTFFDILLSFG